MVKNIRLSKASFLVNFNRWYIFFVVFFVSAGCVNGLLLVTPPDLQIAMNNAKKLRTDAENRVQLVNIAKAQGKINLSDLQRIENSYGMTQQLFSTWIESVQNDLRFKQLGSKSVDYKKLSENAANQAKDFNALVDGVLHISSRGDEIETVLSFIKVGTDLMKTIQKVEENKRQELISKLENLRWKSYIDI